MLDNLSRGRVSYIFGIGYRPAEYELFGLPYDDRGQLADEKLAIVIDELTKASVPTIRVRASRPRRTRPADRASRGVVRSKVAARRAGRNGLDFFGSGRDEGIEEAYTTAAKEAGHEPGACMVPQPEQAVPLFVSDDQDAAWDEIGAVPAARRPHVRGVERRQQERRQPLVLEGRRRAARGAGRAPRS